MRAGGIEDGGPPVSSDPYAGSPYPPPPGFGPPQGYGPAPAQVPAQGYGPPPGYPPAPADRRPTPAPVPAKPMTPGQLAGVSGLVLTQVLLVFGAVSVNLALPSMVRDLALSHAVLGWLVAAYTLPLGALPLVAGRLGEALGRRQLYFGGLGLFALCSVAAALGHSAGEVIMARTGQGLGAALGTAGAIALLERTALSRRGREVALGCYFAAGLAAFPASIPLSALLLEHTPGWRWILWSSALLGLALLLFTAVTLPETASRPAGPELATALSASVGLILLTRGVSRGLAQGWTDHGVWAWFAGAVLLLAVALIADPRDRRPLTGERVRELLGRYGAYLTVALLATALLASFSVLLTLFQVALGHSPLESGQLLLPAVAATVLAALVLPRFARVLGGRAVGAGAALLAALGCGWLARTTLATGYASGILPPLLLVAFGAGGAIAIVAANAREVGGARLGALNTSFTLSLSAGATLVSGLAANAALDYLRAPDRAGPASRALATAWVHAAVPTGFGVPAVLAALAAVIAGCTLPARGAAGS